MNRLFVKIKTDPKFKSTLFEISTESKVGETLGLIVKMMQEKDNKSKLDYHMIRLGSPKRILENKQTFGEGNVGNNDTLLITADAQTIMSQDLFEFDMLTLESQYMSVQEIRAPLRAPMKEFTARDDTTQRKATQKAIPKQVEKEYKLPQEQTKGKQNTKNTFDFEPLDLDFNEPVQEDKSKKGSKSLKE